MGEQETLAQPFDLERNSWEQLVLTDASGRKHTGVEPIRAFPLTDPGHAISICDNEGKELVYIDSLEDLPPELCGILEQELARREFVPRILRILNDPPDTEPTTWKVETDRGATTFQVESEDDVHRLGSNRFSVVDSNGIRYLIAETGKLDKHSRRVLQRFF